MMVHMQLYRGSNEVVTQPDVLSSCRGLDFGAGFYTTTNLDQAMSFSKKVALKRKGRPVVSVYEFDEGALDHMRVRRFEGPDHDWLDFVIANRRGEDVNTGFDIVIGPVADDDVYGTIALFESGFYSEEEALDHLKVKRLFNQYVFVSDKALSHIRFKGEISSGE